MGVIMILRLRRRILAEVRLGVGRLVVSISTLRKIPMKEVNRYPLIHLVQLDRKPFLAVVEHSLWELRFL